jgi:hypothetical protein
MPFKSKAQMRAFYAMEADGELPKGTAKKWSKETKNKKGLPEKVKTACLSYFTKLAAELFIPEMNPPISAPQMTAEAIRSEKDRKLQGMSPAEYRTARAYATRNVINRNTRFRPIPKKD